MLRTGIVIVSMYCAAAYGGAAAAESIAQPSIQPQDTWTYRDTTEQRPNVWRQSHFEGTVLRNSGTTILLKNMEVGSSNPPTELLINSDWSRFRSINGQETVVNRPFVFPLTVGKAWNLEYVDDHPNSTNHKSEKRKLHYRVTGWEDVEVPAGKFKAFKIEAEGTWFAELAPRTAATIAMQAGAAGTSSSTQTVNVTASTTTGRIYEAVWYVPEVKRAVKNVEEYYDSNGVRNERITAELESYKVAN